MPSLPSHKSHGRPTSGHLLYRWAVRAIWFWGVPAIAAVICLSRVVVWETERWWFLSLGQGRTFQTLFLWRLGAFCVTAAFFAVLMGLNARYAWSVAASSSAPLGLTPSWDGTGSRRLIPLEDKLGLDRYRGVGTAAAIVIPAWLAGLTAANLFTVWLGALYPQSFGRTDPYWGLDAAFYVFRLSALESVAEFVFWALVLSILLTSLIYIYEEAIELGGRETSIVPAARMHLGILCAVLVMWKAVVWRLDALDLQSSGGLAPGYFGYVTAHYRLPALLTGSWLALPAGGLIYLLARKGKTRALVLFTMAFPMAVWIAWAVVPSWRHVNAVNYRRDELESDFLKERTRATIESWQLGKIQTLNTGGTTRLNQEAGELAKLPIWPAVAVREELNNRLKESSFQLTAGRPHLEEWLVSGKPRLVYTLGLQDNFLNSDSLKPGGSRGAGLAVVDACRRNRDGSLVIYSAALLKAEPATGLTPAQAPEASGEFRGSVTFGEWLGNPAAGRDMPPRTRDMDESDQGTSNNAQDWMATEVTAPNAVLLENPWRRALAAWRFQNWSIMKGEFDSLYWHRRILQRCQQLAPFLDWDHADPRLVAAGDGRLVWLLDGFASTRSFPGAAMPPLPGTPFAGTNYVRRIAVATVDAQNGQTEFYAQDAKEPFTALYKTVFPELIRDLEHMPTALKKQVREPDALFSARAAIWARYHSGSEGANDVPWMPGLGDDAVRDGDFTFRSLAPAATKSPGTVLVAAYALNSRGLEKYRLVPALLIQNEAGKLFSWQPKEPVKVDLATVNGDFNRSYYQDPTKRISGLIPIEGGLALVSGEAHEDTTEKTITTSPHWSVLTREGWTPFNLESQVPRTLTSVSKQLLESWIRNWEAYQKAQREQKWDEMDEPRAELDRLAEESRQNLPALGAPTVERVPKAGRSLN